MKQTLQDMLRDEAGATAIEYGLLLAVFATMVLFGIKELANGSGNLWDHVEEDSVAALAASQH